MAKAASVRVTKELELHSVVASCPKVMVIRYHLPGLHLEVFVHLLRRKVNVWQKRMLVVGVLALQQVVI